MHAESCLEKISSVSSFLEDSAWMSSEMGAVLPKLSSPYIFWWAQKQFRCDCAAVLCADPDRITGRPTAWNCLQYRCIKGSTFTFQQNMAFPQGRRFRGSLHLQKTQQESTWLCARLICACKLHVFALVVLDIHQMQSFHIFQLLKKIMKETPWPERPFGSSDHLDTVSNFIFRMLLLTIVLFAVFWGAASPLELCKFEKFVNIFWICFLKSGRLFRFASNMNLTKVKKVFWTRKRHSWEIAQSASHHIWIVNRHCGMDKSTQTRICSDELRFLQ